MKLNSKGSSIARRLIGTITRRLLVFSQVAFHHPANLYFKMILSSPGEKVDGEYLFRDGFRKREMFIEAFFRFNHPPPPF